MRLTGEPSRGHIMGMSNNKTQMLKVRVSETDLELLRALAEVRGESMSALVRRMAYERARRIPSLDIAHVPQPRAR